MKKFVSILSVVMLSSALLVGCSGGDDNSETNATGTETSAEESTENGADNNGGGEANSENGENGGAADDDVTAAGQRFAEAMQEYASLTMGLSSYEDKMDDDDKAEYTKRAQEIVEMSSKVQNNPEDYATVEAIDELTKQAIEINDSLKVIAEKVGYEY